MEQPNEHKRRIWLLLGLLATVAALAVLYVWENLTDSPPYAQDTIWLLLGIVLGIWVGIIFLGISAWTPNRSRIWLLVGVFLLTLAALHTFLFLWANVPGAHPLTPPDSKNFLIGIPLALWAVILSLSVPAGIKLRSWKGFVLATVVSMFGIVIPFVTFLLSALLVPHAKAYCNRGWIDCFHGGKLALTPLVLWALAALFATDILRVSKPPRPWIVLGVTVGAVVGTICLVIGLFIGENYEWGMQRLDYMSYIIPVYVSVWFTVRAIQLVRDYPIRSVVLLQTFLASLPFWIASLLWSRWIYGGLPQEFRGCFVVTAACQGHRAVVGPLVLTRHNGFDQTATQQLITLWRFEDLWRREAPRSHAVARSVYNRIGPIIAGLIRGPVIADIAYLALKPIEMLARLILWSIGRSVRGLS